ncbi:MAG: RNA-binding protein [bacterium]
MGKTVQSGQLVSSKAGRDKGRYYLVVYVGNDNNVFVADGTGRIIAAPKKKNIKHLIVHRQIAAAVAAKLQAGQNIDDRELRTALSALVGDDGQARSEEVD